MNPAARVLGFARYPILVVSVLAGLTMFVPFLVLVATSWTEGAFLSFPPQGFSLDWYAQVIGDRRWTEPFWLSLEVSAAATIIAVVVGTAGAVAVSRLGPSAARWVRTLFVVPIALPPIAYAVGLYGVDQNLAFLDGSMGTLVVGEALLATPYVFVLVTGAVGRIDPALRGAAATMGARWPLILWRVELPLLLPNIIGGAIFAFNLAFDEVVLSVFLLPPGEKTLPLTMLNASREALSPALTAASTLVSLLALVVLGAFAWVTSRRSSRSRTARHRPRKVVA